MDRFEPLVLSLALRPALREHEPILLIQNKVGLYIGNKKALAYNDGTVYLTAQRLLYVDRKAPQDHSVSLELAAIKSIHWQAGFLTSSPKITFDLFPPSGGTGSLSMAPADSPSGHAHLAGRGLETEPGPVEWECNICQAANPSRLSRCALCGVVRVMEASGRGSSREGLPARPEPSSPLELACPACTFHNHPSMPYCELCGTALASEAPAAPPSEPPALPPSTSVDSIKLSFRNGGSSAFMAALQGALRDEAWRGRSDGPLGHDIPVSARAESTENGPARPFRLDPSTSRTSDPNLGGISQIVRRVDASHRVTDDTLSEAFQDLGALQAKASQMVTLAETLMVKTNRDLTQSPQPHGSPARSDTDSAGTIYHQELAKELEEFLENILFRFGGIMTLVDVYCLFNRARGVALVSPEDIFKACQSFESHGLSLRLRRFPSGLLAVQSSEQSDHEVAERFGQYLRTFGAMTAAELASYEQMAVPLISELLLVIEARGDICRDDSLEGLKFYPNRFCE
ncbi:EAP30/Vps36 family-domain-containing protein [Dimargaris cristalligena]|uniref:Vacuolar protein-sorting-associated protein 36 n=1 Tax=Dimargaris cristalligena TaxID=215637 RepID=A0A4P9ZWE2_9FUNG|nr:EAP30/Vps36 family-domain-containing protein [Dimargaris cristalligena]|eukprot:RKP37976.1 EAP30/Vps36 family-domain-containing protein [Dimargaris cristalligena]